jgi:hypothetical protein
LLGRATEPVPSPEPAFQPPVEAAVQLGLF